ncbi:MAG: hypothetical protein HZA46_11150, partial [Planctomycetales bacterium]|nr:hypothetical protein [Planctomycetales bacterium]
AERLLAEQELKEIEWILKYQDLANYRYWRTRGMAEREPETGEAHRILHEAEEQFFRKGVEDPSELVLSGLTKLEAMFKRHPTLTVEQELLEEGIFGLLLWMEILNRNGRNLPDDFPLKELWTVAQDKLPEFRQDFLRKMNAPR